jgi:hypothetical protein
VARTTSARAELGEPPERPSVALEGRFLLALASQEDLDGRTCAVCERLEYLALAARQAVVGVRQFLQEADQRRREQRQGRSVPRQERLDRSRLRSADGLPTEPAEFHEIIGYRAAKRPERFEFVRRQFAEPVEVWSAGKRADVDQLELGRVMADVSGQRENLEQLKLIIEVVLEPEDDGPARGDRSGEERVAILELVRDRA